MQAASTSVFMPTKVGEDIPHRMSSSGPTSSQLMVRWFTWYCRRYIRRHFHSLRVSRGRLPPKAQGVPVVVFSNHASWWDPLVGLVLKDAFYPDRRLFVPIDSRMLERYAIFSRLGFFGVEKETPRGAAQFLRTSQMILRQPDSILAVTPQSRLADVRERPVRFHRGLGHLAFRCRQALFLPVAMEFVFWEERLPEILVRFGEPVEVGTACNKLTADEWTNVFEHRLATAQNVLSGESQGRNPSNFECVVRGGAGQGGIYDWWQSLRSRLRGEPFKPEHGHK